MRIYSKRYCRDVSRYNLALRFIAHNVRSDVICRWTGLSDRCVTNAFRSYGVEGQARPQRHRGPLLRQVSFFLEAKNRREAITLASLLVVGGALPREPMPNAPQDMPGLEYGERICKVYESYIQQFPQGPFSLERTLSLAVLLAQRKLLRIEYCERCGAIMLVDPMSGSQRICSFCKPRASKRYVVRTRDAIKKRTESIGTADQPEWGSATETVRKIA